MAETFLDIRQAADYLAVSTETIRRLITTGKLPRLKIRSSLRIRRAALEEFIHANETMTVK